MTQNEELDMLKEITRQYSESETAYRYILTRDIHEMDEGLYVLTDGACPARLDKEHRAKYREWLAQELWRLDA